jgi:hypothetical protein
MWLRLASHFRRPVSEVQASINSVDFSEWCAFYAIEPFGYSIENYRAGVIAAAVVNALTKAKAKPLDFFQRRKPVSTWQDQLALVVELNKAFGGLDLRENKS